MKKLLCLLTVSMVILAINSCQKEDSGQPENTPKLLMNQNPKFITHQAKCNSITQYDIITVLERNVEKITRKLATGEGEKVEFKTNNDYCIDFDAYLPGGKHAYLMVQEVRIVAENHKI